MTKKAKLMIESSQNAALLAIETFNNPNSRFKTENFVMLINNAWLKIFIAYLYINNQDIYERDKNGNYVFINGTKEKKTKGFKECLSICKTVLSLAEYENIKELNQVRDRIEHFFIDEPNLDLQLFGRFQSNIMNYERFLAANFGDNYCINRSLAFSLQFSQFNEKQVNSMKTLLSQEARDLKKFLKEYVASLSANILGSQEFCLKVLMIPKVSNTNNSDFAVEFIREDQIESNTIETINTLIKDKRVIIEAKNSGTLKPKQVIDLINKQISEVFNQHHFVAICKIFRIRPYGKNIQNPYDTYAEFCTYDEPHKDYVYTTSFVDFVSKLFLEKKWNLEKINLYNQEQKKIKPTEI